MFKYLYVLMVALAFGGATPAFAVDTPTPTFTPTPTATPTATPTENPRLNAIQNYGDKQGITAKGGTLADGSVLAFNTSADTTGGVLYAFRMPSSSVTPVVAGNVVSLNSSGRAVKSSANGDTNAIGVAYHDQYRNSGRLYVQMVGVATVLIGQNITVGSWYSPGANGLLTPTSAVTAANFLSVSPTVMFRALESATYPTSTSAKFLIRQR